MVGAKKKDIKAIRPKTTWDWKQLKCVKIMGWWPYDIASKKRRVLSRIQGLLLFLILPIDLILQSISLCLAIKTGTLRTSLNIIPMLAISTSMTIKASLWVFRSNEIKFIVEQFKELEKRSRQIRSTPDVLSIIDSHVQVCHLCLYIFLLPCVGGFHWAVRPITYASSGEFSFIVEDYVPWNDENFTGWIIHFIFTFVVLCIAMTAYATYETLSFAFYEMIIAHLKIISLLFSTINSESNATSLIHLHTLHRDLHKLINDIGSLQSVTLQADCLLYTFILCCGVFEITHDWSPLTKRINLVETCSVAVSLFFWHCYKCQTIIHMCSNMTYIACNNNWYQGTNNYRKSLSMITQRSLKPVKFGSIININLNTFIWMMKTSFSYYNALKAFNIH